MALVGCRGGLLTGQLGAAVSGERRGLIGLDVGGSLGAVEDVVAGDVDDGGVDRGGRRGDVAGAGAVDGERLLLRFLGAVDVGPGGAVDDDVGALQVELLIDGVGVDDVQLGVAEADHVMPGVPGGEHHVAAEHPGGACDQHLHAGKICGFEICMG